MKGVKEVKKPVRKLPARLRVPADVFTSLTPCTSFSLSLFISLTLFTSLVIAQQTPSFRTRVEVVQLDVSVLDRHRQPVKGLTEKDFTILEDGKPQRIVGFSTFDIDDGPPPATGWMRDVPADVTTNELKESRLFVIVLDDALIPQEPFSIKSSKAVAASIIEKLEPNDITAIIFTGDNRKTQDFTNDKTKLLAALDKFNPGLAGYRFGMDSPPPAFPPSGDPRMLPPPEDTDLWFYQSSIRTLQNVANYLMAVPNRRKVLFWISSGVPVDVVGTVPKGKDGGPIISKEALICMQGSSCDNPMDTWAMRLPPSTMIALQQRTQEIFLNAQRANVTIYPIDPAGLDGMKQYLAMRLGSANLGFAQHKATVVQDFLAAAAANTGGRTVMNTNDFEPGITGIFEENASYYLIGFERADATADGKLHKLQVKVNRPDVEVRTRSGYYAPEPEKSADKKNAKNPVTPEAAALAKAMGGILPVGDLPMRVSVAPFAVPGQRLSTVTVVLGIRQPVPAAAAKDRITETTELLTSAFTPEGDARGAQRHTAKVTIRAGADGEASYEALARIDLPAGRYRLRLAAHNATSGKDGSVFADVTVPDYSGIPFSASPVVLNATPGRVSAPKDLFAKVLPFVPTAERDFTMADRVTAFLRLYQSGQKPVERVQLSIRIRDAKDQIKVDETQIISAEQFPSAGQAILSQADTGPAPPTRGSGAPPVIVGRGGISTTPTTPTADQFANFSLRTADIKYAIPFARLSPGPHLLTFEATMGQTTLRRDVRFEVK